MNEAFHLLNISKGMRVGYLRDISVLMFITVLFTIANVEAPQISIEEGTQ